MDNFAVSTVLEKKISVWLVVVAISADFVDEVSKESDAFFGTNIP
jgi:hypothetical protein